MPLGKNMLGTRPSRVIHIEDLYDRYAHLVYRRCLVLLGNSVDAEDALQEVYIRAMKSTDGFRGESSPMTWLYRICTNHCFNFLRSNKRRKKAMEKQKLQTSEAAWIGLKGWEDMKLALKLLASCDRSTQEVVVYHFLDGMSQEEVANQTKLSVPTVRKRLRKFLLKAKKKI